MLLCRKYMTIVLNLMHVEIQSYVNVRMYLCYSGAFAIVWKVHAYCPATNTRGDSFCIVVCMYLCWCNGRIHILFYTMVCWDRWYYKMVTCIDMSICWLRVKRYKCWWNFRWAINSNNISPFSNFGNSKTYAILEQAKPIASSFIDMNSRNWIRRLLLKGD